MQKEGIEPDTGICGALMTAYSMKGDINRCHQILHYMKMNGISVTIVEYCTLLKCYLFANKPLDALNVYENVMKPVIEKATLDHKLSKLWQASG